MWTAVVLGSLVLGGLAAYGAWGAHAVARGASVLPFVIGLPLVYLAVPFVFTCLWFTLAWAFRAERPDDIQLTAAARLRLFANEFWALAKSAPRMIGYRYLMRDPDSAPAELPVLLVHGVGCNAGVWFPFRRSLEHRAIGPVYALSYGPPLASIEHFAEQLAVKVDAVRKATGSTQVVLVAHSMGGLISRAYLRRFGGTYIRRLITIGTPHQGSKHAYLMGGRGLSEMRPGSAWLTDLNREGESTTDGVSVVSLWSWHDSMVTPQTSSLLEGAENIALTGIGHNALLNDPEVFARVAAEIERAGGARPTSEFPASAARMPSARA
ncbi:MAG: alpha/beta fold hydrolase [Betaproteobacteria bacterium]|nr:alpha/beta fold hydrolase [Betaproteobacteria bacterium]